MKEMLCAKTHRDNTFIKVSGITALALLMLVSIAGAVPYAFITNQESNTASTIDTATDPAEVNITQITTSGSAFNPAIYGDKIVWEDARNGNSVIYLYDLSTSNETQITASDEYTYKPVIYGNKIVYIWGSDTEPDYFIEMYDLSTKNVTWSWGWTNDYMYPDIYGNRIVWGYIGIFMYDLSTNTETQITTSQSASNPHIYGDRVVYDDTRSYRNYDIYMYDLSTKKETQITTSGSASNPRIYGDKIVWSDGRYGQDGDYYSDIYMYDLSTKKETRITTSGSASYPAIYEDTIVWKDLRDFDPYADKSNIYIYDLSTNTETQITKSGSASNPAIYEDRIVWQDSRNGNSDIYMATLSSSNTLVAVFPGYTNPPTDLDQNGLYEDINGNGVLDFDDVVAYYDNMEWIEANMPIELFDYNNNGLIDFDDVVKLYDML
jgi:beta propeller repeat protein